MKSSMTGVNTVTRDGGTGGRCLREVCSLVDERVSGVEKMHDGREDMRFQVAPTPRAATRRRISDVVEYLVMHRIQ